MGSLHTFVRSIYILVAAAVAVLVCLPHAAMCEDRDRSEDRAAIEKLAGDFLKYFSDKNLEGMMSLVSDEYSDSVYDKKGYEDLLKKVLPGISGIKSSCIAGPVEFRDDLNASVVLKGVFEFDKNTPEGQVATTADCERFWIERGGDYIRKEQGVWKLYGSHKRVWNRKASVGFLLMNPFEAMLAVQFKDVSRGVKSAQISGYGLKEKMSLVEQQGEEGGFSQWYLPQGPHIDVNTAPFPLKYTVEYNDDAGPGSIVYEIKKPEAGFPVPLSPKDTEAVVCPVSFKWRALHKQMPGLKYTVKIFDTSGNVLDNMFADREEAVYDCGKLAPGSTYFYKVSAADGEGNHYFSGIQSFHIRGDGPENYPVYSFVGPDDFHEYSGRNVTWMGGVLYKGDKIIASDFINYRIDVIDSAGFKMAASFRTGSPISEYCAADGKIFFHNRLDKKIEIQSYSAVRAGEWEFDAGGGAAPVVCDGDNKLILIANLKTGMLEKYDFEGKKSGEMKLPEKTIAFDIGDGGDLFFADEYGALYKYSADGKLLAKWSFPIVAAQRRGVYVFSETGTLEEIVNPTFDAQSTVISHPVALKVVKDKVYAGYVNKNECGSFCGMFFDVTPDGAVIFSNTLR